jgi:hypothetical protein
MAELCPDCGRHRPSDEEWEDSVSGTPVYERGWCLVEHDDHYSSATNGCRGITIALLRAKLAATEAKLVEAERERETLETLRRAQLTQAQAEMEVLRAELERINGKRFPVHSGGMTVPWLMLAPHEQQAVDNHGQTLQRLAERGGLGWAEMLCVLEGRSWQKRSVSSDELAKPKVLALVAAFDAARAKLKETTDD